MALGAQAGHEAQPVEIAAGQLAVAQADRVDGADQARGRRDLVAQDGGLFLVGHGDDQPAQVMQAAQAGEQRRQAVGRDVERDHDAVGAALAQQGVEPLRRLDVRDRVRRDRVYGCAAGDFHLIVPCLSCGLAPCFLIRLPVRAK